MRSALSAQGRPPSRLKAGSADRPLRRFLGTPCMGKRARVSLLQQHIEKGFVVMQQRFGD